MPSKQVKPRALISVSDKDNIDEFVARLCALDWEIISTGGTARMLRDAGHDVSDVSAITEFPEMMDGRIKTLHPKIHGGLLALRDNAEHVAAMRKHEIGGIDLLVVNLYPFEETLARGGSFDECIENIDIGGPAMVRAAAKNHRHVCVVTDPGDYIRIADMLEQKGEIDADVRRELAAKAFSMTAAYDSAISAWLDQESGNFPPRHYTTGGHLVSSLRYGENPHQKAAFYRSGAAVRGVGTAEQVQGKALSYNNLNDTDAAFELISDLVTTDAAVAIIKHANPCGVAVSHDLDTAYKNALRCDPVSAFGGIVALNRPLTGSIAKQITEIFTEVVIAPDADEEARSIFAKKKNLRLLLTGGLADPHMPRQLLRPIAGGFLVQDRDNCRITRGDLKVVTKKQPDAAQIEDMLFAFTVAKHVKSNAIVYVNDGATVGVGAGQMSRLDSSRIAARKAEDATKEAGLSAKLTEGCVVASDAFFPFADGLLAAVSAGAVAVIQPGGSVRDNEIIAAADEAGIVMVFTGIRHFRH